VLGVDYMPELKAVAVVGGHGLVAKAIIKDLLDYEFPLSRLVVYGSKQNSNIDLVVNGRTFKVETIDEEHIEKFDLVFFSTGEDLSDKYASLFIEKGARVIDNSSYFRMKKDVPLVIPEINEDDLLNDSMIYANPNCTTILILLALWPVHKLFRLEKIIVSSYQSVSGAGSLALQEYVNEAMSSSYEAQVLPSANALKKPIYNNILPVVDDLLENGFTKEEEKIENESKKILHMDELEINPTCVRVPTLVGHGVSIAAICKEKIDLGKLKEAYKECPYLRLKDNNDYPDLKGVVDTPFVDIGRLKIDKYCEFTVDLFATSDNLVRGASYNAVQIAFSLIRLGVL